MWKRLRKPIIILASLLPLAFIGIQLLPVDRSNPPITMDVAAPAEVQAVLRHSCYDCHSNETQWPWYSYVAPVSWLIADDVHEGRKHLNFSTWDQYTPEKRGHKLEEAYEEAVEGEMPLPNYLRMHPDAKLSSQHLNLLREWANAHE